MPRITIDLSPDDYAQAAAEAARMSLPEWLAQFVYQHARPKKRETFSDFVQKLEEKYGPDQGEFDFILNPETRYAGIKPTRHGEPFE